ncbi:MAG: hypothetical protein HY672_04990 [Chloroflexi bacterium]|nr:hypothetical protein [Chloroflexota bacterium]
MLLTLLLVLVGCTQSRPTATPTLTLPTATATSTPTFVPTEATASPLAPVFDRILRRVTAIRRLEPLEPIVPRFMTREQLTTRLREDLDKDRGDILNSQELLRILGLIPQDADLYQMLLALYTEQVVGFYDTETEELYLITGKETLTPSDEITLAHEYTHALQQQHFDIHALTQGVEADSEADSALSALIEGDASAVQLEYMSSYLTSKQRQEVLNASGDTPTFDASPYILRQSLLFPYSQGEVLVGTLLLSGNWSAVDKAYLSAPVSTEQVLHPEKYLEGEMPVPVSLPDVATSLGLGWESLYEDVMGEFFLRTYLETRTRADLASRSAAGWGGDRFNLMGGPQQERALVALLAWDSRRDAQEFFDVLRSTATASGKEYLAIRKDRVLWVLSNSSATIEAVISVFQGF